MTKTHFYIVTLALVLITNIDAWTFPSSSSNNNNRPSLLDEKTVVDDVTSSCSTSRRQLFLTAATGLFSTSTILLSNLQPSLAATSSSLASNPQTKTDKENILKGYNRLTYLLNNWEKETTVCGRSDNPYIGCERTPEKVMDYLGFKSMNDPLFRIDKTLLRLQPLVKSGSDEEIDYMEAMESINQAVEDGNGIAFVSSWGEANPGGGKDRIELFIERSKRYVIATRDGLGTVMKILDIKEG